MIGYLTAPDLYCAHIMGDTYIAWGVGFPARIIRSRWVHPTSRRAPCGMDGRWSPASTPARTTGAP